MIVSMDNEYLVVVTFRAVLGQQPQPERRFNLRGLEATWRTIDQWRGKPLVKRIRIYAELDVFDIT